MEQSLDKTQEGVELLDVTDIISDNTIFIQIAAYRDSELKKTLRDCIAKAAFPQNLVFSICWQHAKEDDWDDLDEFKDDPRFKIIDIDYRQSGGVCWARNMLQQQYNGERYTLQLDSHHRFVKGWDLYLIDTYLSLQAKGFKKPLLTGYVPGYDPQTEVYINKDEVWTLRFNRFAPDDGMLHVEPQNVPDTGKITMPIRGRLYSAHFAFTTGLFVKEVPHDPQMYFHGEEPSIAVRAFTHGYDLFHPHRCYIYHFYERKGFKRHWDDNGSQYDKLNSRAHDRFRRLLGIRCDREDLGMFGLGTERSLDEYEKFSGIRFKDCSVQKYTINNYPPPNPYYAIKEQYDQSFLPFFKHCIDIGYHEVPEKDYEFWVVAFRDEYDQDVYRQDAGPAEIERYFNDPDKYCKIWREFFYDRVPVKALVWPFSTSKGWADPIWKDLRGKAVVKAAQPAPSLTVLSRASRLPIDIFTGKAVGNYITYADETGGEGRGDFDNFKENRGGNIAIIYVDPRGIREENGVVHGYSEDIKYEKKYYRVFVKTQYPITKEMHDAGMISVNGEVLTPYKIIDPGITKDFHAVYGNDVVRSAFGKWIEEMDAYNKEKHIPQEPIPPPASTRTRTDMVALYKKNLETPYTQTPGIATIDDVNEEIALGTFSETILVHLPAYREPELIPTILDALFHATHPARIHFGICRQYNPADGFDNLNEFRGDPRFKIIDIPYEEAKGLPYARGLINDTLLTDEDYVLQLDAHHRFVKDWDCIMIGMLNELEADGVEKPILTGYTPQYSPFNDPGDRVTHPWMSGFRCFYPFGTIFIGPQSLNGWETATKPIPARFLCGHFDFARSQWARDVRHDPSIYFAGEEINLTVRSWTHGYDFYHPHRLVLWHGTMREERSQICKWDDDNRKGIQWDEKQNENRKMIMKLFGIEDHPHITLDPTYGLGTARTVAQYEKFAGLDFKRRAVQQYTVDNQPPPNPLVLGDYTASLKKSFYYVVNVKREDFPRNDYKHILVAFDDENGMGINLEYQPPNFQNGVIHYAKYFTHDMDKRVARVVYWGQTMSDEWAERVEITLPVPEDYSVPTEPFIQNVSRQDIVDGKHFEVGDNTILIQILDAGEDFPDPKFNPLERYYFAFSDEWNSKGVLATEKESIQPAQAEAIAKVLRHAAEIKANVLVHCLVGECRSSAISAAAKTIGFSVLPNKKNNRPNQRVLSMVLEKLKS